jgi:6-phosphogluconate dehydrogenase
MELGMIGLGRMGGNMAIRLIQGGHRVVVYNRTPTKTREIAQHGAVATFSLQELVEQLQTPRAIWIMLPAGQPTRDMINQLLPLISPGDILIDGGNSHYTDDAPRAAMLSEHGIHYVDAGVSGGIWGLQVGYCMMVGGEPDICAYLEPIFKTLAPENGYLYCGPHGAGHYVKMVHNGIEYGMLQAIGEGFEILHAAPFKFDLAKIAALWQHGSVVRSWLIELAAAAFSKDPDLETLRGYVEDSGEGRWTILEAMERDIPAPVITLSLLERFRSRQPESFSAKVIAALRNEFGGHAVQKAE